MKKPIVLCILDGVGFDPRTTHNAVAIAKMPFLNSLIKKYPNSKLCASGAAVGLPTGVMGNSEVGHITIGSGRIVNQFLRRFQLENFDKNKPLGEFIKNIKKSKGTVNLVGLMSDGCVHSNINDIIKIAKIVLESNLKVQIHFIADGRDTPPKSAVKYINKLKRNLAPYFEKKLVWFASLSGRYYAMDRNQNNARTEMAANAIADQISDFSYTSINAALKSAYNRDESDEFINPAIINSQYAKKISKEDGILFCNYRSDRARQLLRYLIPATNKILCFSQYGEGLDSQISALLFDEKIENTLGDVLSVNGKSQLRIAETEKYNHVTYFFDAEQNIDLIGEKKILIPSPDVKTFDLKPEMSAPKITDALLPELSKFDVVVLNFANGDMVGHTGIESAAIFAMECLDKQLKKIVPAVLNLGGVILITADHGNAEKMWNEKLGVPWTAHTTNLVNFIVVSNDKLTVKNGGLSDVAPTILQLVGVKKPIEMTGVSLIG